MGTTLVQLGGMCSCFIGATDPVAGDGGLSLSCVQREHMGRVSSSPASLGGELEVGRSATDAQRGVLVQGPFL